LSSEVVVTKYGMAAEVVDMALAGIVTQCVEGKSVVDICKFGDTVVDSSVANYFKAKKDMDKGLAFPTCVSVNNCLCHFSPLSEDEAIILKDGDKVSIDVGVHIDGFISVGAHTLIVGASAEKKIEGKQADVMMAAYNAGQAALALIKPGNTNAQVTEVINKIAAAYEVNACQGVLMHQMKRYVIDGNKVVILREEIEHKVEEYTFEANEVYAIDVAFSSGEGKPRESETRTTVFKRAVDKSYRLKMKASRFVFNEVNNRFPTLPFTLRALGDESQARMGVVECLKHELLHPYPALFEKEEDSICHLKFTALLLPSGTKKITLKSCPLNLDGIVTEKKLTDELAELIATAPVEKKKKAKKKKK
jgi:curved DNA binding protein